MKMKCYRCGIEMVPGTAIKPNIDGNALTIMPVAPITAETLKLVNVWKCPTCGHSEEKNESKKRN